MKCTKDSPCIDFKIENIEGEKESDRIDIEEEMRNILKGFDSNSLQQFGSDSDDTQLKDSNNATHDRFIAKLSENHEYDADSYYRSNVEAYLVMNDEDPFEN